MRKIEIPSWLYLTIIIGLTISLTVFAVFATCVIAYSQVWGLSGFRKTSVVWIVVFMLWTVTIFNIRDCCREFRKCQRRDWEYKDDGPA